jgi:FkbM family methyltransferase
MASAGQTFATTAAPRGSFALDELDLKLIPFLPQRPGVFVEAGANDGISQSNTLYLERYLGWRGLLIEPHPKVARRCRRNRPNAIVERCALVPFGYPKRHVEMRYCNLMSVVRGAMASASEEDTHIEAGCKVQEIETHNFKARARPLTEILDKHRLTGVDLLVLDVEGFELPVLKGLDFSRHRPELMLIEARYRDDIDQFLAPLYETVATLSHHDVLYRARSPKGVTTA